MYKALENFVIKYFSNDRRLIFNLWLLKLVLYHCPQHIGNYVMMQSKKIIYSLKREKSLLSCDDKHGIAIGNLTSQTFANFFLTLLDRFIKDVLGYIYYGRYIDDFFLIHEDKNKLLSDYKRILEFVKTIDLEINRNKFYLQYYKKGVPFVGFFVFFDRLQLLNSTKYRFYRRIYELEKIIYNRFGNSKRISLISAGRIQATWNSYMGIISHTKSQCIIKRIFELHPWLISKMSEVFDFEKDLYYIRIKDEIKNEGM
jgi:hypothetical protein